MSRRKLLLADDSITIQKVVNLTFADEGIDVTTVGDGDAALAHLGGVTPDIVLADVNMPGPTGYQICEQLRASDATKNVPVILLVGSFEPFDETEAARVGANAYLTKPFQSIKQLIAQVNELIDASKPTTAELSVAETAQLAAADVFEEEPSLATDTPELVEQEWQPQPTETADTIQNIKTVDAVDTVESIGTVDAVETTPRYFDDLGYETSLQSPPAAAQPDDDIDDLYSQSIDRGSDDLSDVGIDDEMIETSYTAADENSDLTDFTTEAGVAQVEKSFQPEPVAEFEPAAVSEVATPVEEVAELEPSVQTDEVQDSSMDTVEYHNWKPADMRGDSYSGPTFAPEEVKAEVQHEAGTESSFAEANVEEDTIKMDDRFDSTSSSFKFDDVDLLDLSAGPSQPVEITTPSNAVEHGSNKQIVTLSPELIEMIAQRVVEKMSEKY